MVFRRIIGGLKRMQRPIIRVTQQVILAVSLSLLYYLGFGISRLFMMVLARRTLFNRPRQRVADDTYWRPAEGYDLEEFHLVRQS